MEYIGLPQSDDQKTDIIQKYFYGTFPNYRMQEEDGSMGYRPYHTLEDWNKDDPEPTPEDIIKQHVTGHSTWATRAVHGDMASFAALDVDTTDPSLLEPLRTSLYLTYGWTYNWEQSESGVHVWFLWDDLIPVDTAIYFLELLQLPPHIKKVIDKRYPIVGNALRLPFPGEYEPVPVFPERNELVILTMKDIHAIIKDNAHTISSSRFNERVSFESTTNTLSHSTKEIFSDSTNNIFFDSHATLPVKSTTTIYLYPTTTTIPGTRNEVSSKRVCTAPGHGGGPVLSGQGVGSFRYTPNPQAEHYGAFSLEGRVRRFLATEPIDGDVYQKLIMEDMLANTVAVYGEREGLAQLEKWIRRGNAGHISRRIGELHKYHRQNQHKQWRVITGCLCTSDHMSHFRQGIFEDVLGFIDGIGCLGNDIKAEIKHNAEQVLFIMLVCVGVAGWHNQKVRAQRHKLIPYISTRQLAGLMGLDETERRKAGTARSYLTRGGKDSRSQSLGIFDIVQQSTNCRSPRFVLNPQFNYLLQRVETALRENPGSHVDEPTSCSTVTPQAVPD